MTLIILDVTKDTFNEGGTLEETQKGMQHLIELVESIFTFFNFALHASKTMLGMIPIIFFLLYWMSRFLFSNEN